MERRTPGQRSHEPRQGGASGSGGIARHFEGWQLLVVAVFIAGSVAALTVPRSVEPTELPSSGARAGSLRDARAADERDADAAEQETLDADVRELGSAMRAYGAADAAEDEAALVREKRRLAETAERAVEAAPEHVRRLRAYQLRVFLAEVRRWEASGESQELRELGGGFVRMVQRSGWVGPQRQLLLDEHALRASFKKRWNEVSGFQGPKLALGLDEQRALLGFLIAHPPRAPGEIAIAVAARPGGVLGGKGYEGQVTLKKIDELGKLDPAYPVHLARGVVLYRLERYPMAVEAFRRHLDQTPDGPYALRAQNYLRAALGRAGDPAL